MFEASEEGTIEIRQKGQSAVGRRGNPKMFRFYYCEYNGKP